MRFDALNLMQELQEVCGTTGMQQWDDVGELEENASLSCIVDQL